MAKFTNLRRRGGSGPRAAHDHRVVMELWSPSSTTCASRSPCTCASPVSSHSRAPGSSQSGEWLRAGDLCGGRALALGIFPNNGGTLFDFSIGEPGSPWVPSVLDWAGLRRAPRHPLTPAHFSLGAGLARLPCES